MAIAELVNPQINQKQQRQQLPRVERLLKESSHAANVLRDEKYLGLPAAQGLYNPDNELDSCGVGFVCQMKGKPSHKIVSDARQLLCNMTHRGGTGTDNELGNSTIDSCCYQL